MVKSIWFLFCLKNFVEQSNFYKNTYLEYNLCYFKYFILINVVQIRCKMVIK